MKFSIQREALNNTVILAPLSPKHHSYLSLNGSITLREQGSECLVPFQTFEAQQASQFPKIENQRIDTSPAMQSAREVRPPIPYTICIFSDICGVKMIHPGLITVPPCPTLLHTNPLPPPAAALPGPRSPDPPAHIPCPHRQAPRNRRRRLPRAARLPAPAAHLRPLRPRRVRGRGARRLPGRGPRDRHRGRRGGRLRVGGGMVAGVRARVFK
jgi:hypothetical protein